MPDDMLSLMDAIEWHVRPRAHDPATTFFQSAELEAVRGWYARAGLPTTPLRRLPALAAELGVGEILIKDERARFGLPSFKILGAHYAVGQIVAHARGTVTDLACATAGNHGLAVACAGAEHGLEVHVSMPIGTPPGVVDAIRAAGAHAMVTSVDYDATVRLMASEAVEHGWTIVSDTAWEGYEAIPRAIMAGYTRLFDEAAGEWGDAPDVVIVQAGVGSLAAAAAGWLAAHYPDARTRPNLVIAEPTASACVLTSLRAGRRTDLERCGPTAMAGLRCARVSPAAWPILAGIADAAIAVPDAYGQEALGKLARPNGLDPAVTAGPSGACGVAALIALCRESHLAPVRDHLGLTRASRCVALITEAAADSGLRRHS